MCTNTHMKEGCLPYFSDTLYYVPLSPISLSSPMRLWNAGIFVVTPAFLNPQISHVTTAGIAQEGSGYR